MKKQSPEKQWLKVFLCIFLTAMLQVNIFGLMFANDTPMSFDTSGAAEGKETTLNNYVIEGAVNFFKSYSNILLLINEIEATDMENIDYIATQAYANKGIANIESARQAYIDLTREADLLPYKQDVISKLKKFDYTDFLVKNDLNGTALTNVKSYLAKGDVKGIYHKILSDFDDILLLLYSVKERIDTKKAPDITELWKLNHSYSTCLLFGQYATQVFKAAQL